MLAHVGALPPQDAGSRASLTDCSGTSYSSETLLSEGPSLAEADGAESRYTADNLVFGVAVTDGVVILLQVGYPFT